MMSGDGKDSASESTPAAELFTSKASDPLTEKIAELERELETERDCRKEDRFVALAAGVILLNIHLMGDLEGFALPIIIFILELMILMVVAKRLGIEQIAGVIDKILDHVPKKPPVE